MSVVDKLPATEMQRWHDYLTGGGDREYMMVALLASIADMVEGFMSSPDAPRRDPISVRMGIWPGTSARDITPEQRRKAHAETVASIHRQNRERANA